MSTHEEWREVKGYGGRYLVSNRGYVKNANSGIVLQQHSNCSKYQYYFVTLYTGSVKERGNKPKYVRRYVHRLVADAFVPNPQDKPEVNHIDSDPHNNVAENLEWVTRSENMIHSNKYGKSAKYKRRVMRDDGVVYESITEAGNAMNYDPSDVLKACNKGWRVRGHCVSLLDETWGR